ncbi:sensor histidine kinase [Nocardioides sp. AX2bis]|uniref:sensor histidine kinase n=1 Tax=Nocardioides sp. AX2bis TaxID=2653157 RepID=UPI0012F1A521|nr:ATP-binding protein [Nocardioides sp. AX2bis]VXB43215.1 putative Histidine kinase [Nocardioides sp. AX2bis]
MRAPTGLGVPLVRGTPQISDPRLLAQIVEASADAIFSEDLAGTITSWNAAAERVYGCSAREMVGRSAGDLLPEVSTQQLQQVRDLALSGERVERFDTWHLRPDGRRIAVSLTVSPLRGAEGEVAGLATSVQDVTERVRSTTELDTLRRTQERANTALARSNRDLEQFAFVASHDLSEPLRAMTGFAELLERRYSAVLDERGLRYVGHVVDGAARMQVLIDDLLEYSRYLLVDPPGDHVDTTAVARRVVDTLAATGVSVGDLPVVGYDESSVVAVLSNLVGNAVKFHRPGTVSRVEVTGRLEDGRVLLQVDDDGIGIEPDHADRVFAMFARLHGREAYPGTGIGLAIVQQVAERSGGTAWVEASPLGGSRFCVTLPAAPAVDGGRLRAGRAADMTSAAERSARDHRSSGVLALDRGTRLRFLLIEDSPTDCELIRSLLEDEFADVVIEIAPDLDHAMGLLATNEYDLVLADLTLPDADGGTVVRAVRGASPQTALMVITGTDDNTLALWALAEGAQDYLVKGEHDGPRLADALLRGLQRSRAEKLTHELLVKALELERKSAEQLRELNRATDEFVATVSHELRTPLASISGYAEMLQEEESLTEAQRTWANVIARNAGRLTALTYDLLLLSGFSTGEVPMEDEEVDLREVVNQVRDLVDALAAGLHLDVSFDLADGPVLVTGDAGQLERVVLNLAGNAIKFSEAGGSVTCRVTADATQALLEVTDTGMGIPADEVEGLFTRYFRGSSARRQAIQGTGLGLHIVASLVENHGGRVDVRSVVGVGTTFTVRLPLVG